MSIDSVFSELFPESDASTSLNQKAKAILPRIGELSDKDARRVLCEMAVASGIDPNVAAKASRLLPEVVGGNVDHEPSDGEMEAEYFQRETPP